MRALLLAALMVMTVPALAQWNTTDRSLMAASSVLLVADWAQTRTIAKTPERFYEMNPILGRHPSVGRVNNYFALSLAANYALAEYLGPANRRRWLISITAVEGITVARNMAIGIRMDF